MRNFAGNLVNVVIPRPGPNGEPTPGLGKVIAKARAKFPCIFSLGTGVLNAFYSENS